MKPFSQEDRYLKKNRNQLFIKQKINSTIDQFKDYFLHQPKQNHCNQNQSFYKQKIQIKKMKRVKTDYSIEFFIIEKNLCAYANKIENE